LNDSDINPTYSSTRKGCSYFKGYHSEEFLSHYCLPDLAWVNKYAPTLAYSTAAIDAIFAVQDIFYTWVDDLRVTYPLILIGFSASVLLGLLYFHLFRCFPVVIAWIGIILFLITAWGGAYLFYDQAQDGEKEKKDEKALAKNVGVKANTSDIDALINLNYFLCGLTCLFALIYTICFLCNFRKVRLAANFIKASVRFVNDNMMIMFVPIINVFITLVLMAGWIYGIIYMYSLGTASKSSKSYPWADMKHDTSMQIAFYFNGIFGFWMVAFMVSFNVFVIGAACVTWYYQQDSGEGQEKGPKSRKSPICTGYCLALGWHMGSIAFGSFIIMTIWLVQMIMSYIERKTRGYTSENCCLGCFFSMIRCCMSCFEKTIRFLNKQAYIQVAITGKSFCSSANKGSAIVLSHLAEFSLLGWIGNGFMYVANCVMCFGSGFMA